MVPPKEPLARLTMDLWYWTSMSTDGSRKSPETSVVGIGDELLFSAQLVHLRDAGLAAR